MARAKSKKSRLPSEADLLFADELLGYRGSSLKGLIKQVINAFDCKPLNIKLRAMEPNERTKKAIREADEHPEQLETYNSVEDWKSEIERLTSCL
jgi:hypothetical protein